MRALREVLDKLARPHHAGMLGRVLSVGPVDRATLELGRDEGSIRADVHVDGKLRLAFGSGEQFAGNRQDLPIRISTAADDLLEVARTLAARMPPGTPGRPPGWASVRFSLRTERATFSDEAKLADLLEGRSALSPLWRAFAEMLEPTVATLFRPHPPTGPRREETPALSRARGLWNGS